MNLAGLAVAVLVHASAAGDALTAPVPIEWFAVQATNENRSPKAMEFGEGLEAVRGAIEKFVEKRRLKLDTFARITHSKVRAAPNKETELGINARYAAFIKPLTRDENGRIRMKVRIEETSERDEKETVRDALNTTSSVAQKTPLLLGGLKLERGNLIGAIIVGD